MRNKISINDIVVYGVDINEQTGCKHYHSTLDIVAIKFKCCGKYYSCHACHAALADHPIERWNLNEFSNTAVLCGACGLEFKICAYVFCNGRCPRCQSLFNPKCKNHWHLYMNLKSNNTLTPPLL